MKIGIWENFRIFLKLQTAIHRVNIFIMVKVKDILKIFGLDWLITVAMYAVGVLVSGFGSADYADVVRYISNFSTSPTGLSSLVDTFTYLFISLCFVILISYLVNKDYLKIATKSFVISQFLYLLSVALIIFLLL